MADLGLVLEILGWVGIVLGLPTLPEGVAGWSKLAGRLASDTRRWVFVLGSLVFVSFGLALGVSPRVTAIGLLIAISLAATLEFLLHRRGSPEWEPDGRWIPSDKDPSKSELSLGLHNPNAKQPPYGIYCCLRFPKKRGVFKGTPNLRDDLPGWVFTYYPRQFEDPLPLPLPKGRYRVEFWVPAGVGTALLRRYSFRVRRDGTPTLGEVRWSPRGR
jgi:hypothetical protein